MRIERISKGRMGLWSLPSVQPTRVLRPESCNGRELFDLSGQFFRRIVSPCKDTFFSVSLTTMTKGNAPAFPGFFVIDSFRQTANCTPGSGEMPI